MITAITIGGAITAACETCGARPSAICLSPQGAPRKKPHAARTRHATPEQTVSIGDLLDVRLASGVRLAHLHAIPDEQTLLVRVWSPGAQAFFAPKAIRRAEAIRLAGDNARTRIAREELKSEAERAAVPISPGMIGALTVNGAKVADVESAEINGHSLGLGRDVVEGRGPFDPVPGQAMSEPAHSTVHKVSDSWFDDSAGTTKPAPKGW